MQDIIILGIIMLSATILTAWAINYVLKRGHVEDNTEERTEKDYEYYRNFRACIQARVIELDNDTYATQAEWDYVFKLAEFSDEMAKSLPSYIKDQLSAPGIMLSWIKMVKAGD